MLPVKPAGKPVKPAGIPVRTVSTGEFKFKFAFVRFRPVTGLTDPVSRNRTPAVRGDRSKNLTLAVTRVQALQQRGVNGFVCEVERDSNTIAPAIAVIAFGSDLR